MKLVISLAALAAVSQSAVAAQKFAKIDLRGRFESTSINLYPDSTPVYAGVDVLIPVNTGLRYSASVQMNGNGTCKILSMKSNTRSSTIRVLTDLEIDDGSCEIKIRLRDGRRAVVFVENVGT
jgi:hypothetical protein